MTMFEQELRKLFGENEILSDVRFVGNVCYGRLNEDVRVKIHFAAGGIANQYDRLKVTLLNRREGAIDSLILRFRDVWGLKQTGNPNFRNGVLPHLWDDSGNTSWYVYKPVKADYCQLAEAVDSYLAVFHSVAIRDSIPAISDKYKKLIVISVKERYGFSFTNDMRLTG